MEKKKSSETDQSTSNVNNEIVSLSLKIPYMGAAGDKLVRTLKRKIQQNLSKKVNIRIFYTTNKLSKFCSTKDRLPDDQKNNLIYHIVSRLRMSVKPNAV